MHFCNVAERGTLSSSAPRSISASRLWFLFATERVCPLSMKITKARTALGDEWSPSAWVTEGRTLGSTLAYQGDDGERAVRFDVQGVRVVSAWVAKPLPSGEQVGSGQMLTALGIHSLGRACSRYVTGARYEARPTRRSARLLTARCSLSAHADQVDLGCYSTSSAWAWAWPLLPRPREHSAEENAETFDARDGLRPSRASGCAAVAGLLLEQPDAEVLAAVRQH